ncbi:MAG: metallophosphoesterase [Actinomycetota bacterium]
MLIVQLTDTHVQGPDVGVKDGIDNNALLAEAIGSINGERPRPDLVLATGDLTNDGRPEELDELLRLLDAIELPLAVIPGNHDDPGAFRAAFDMAWEADDHLSWVIELGPLSIIGLDCTVPDGAPHGDFDDTRAAWLADALARTADRPTLLALHHPPFASGIAAMDASRLRNADAFIAAVAAAPHVERVVCGHLHRPIIGVLTGGERPVPVTTCPATVLHPHLDLEPDTPLRLIEDPIGYQLHRYGPAGWVTNTRYIATGATPWTP